MDNPWYDYAPFPKRPKLAWPKNARVAFCVVLPLEYYELLPAEELDQGQPLRRRVRQLHSRLPHLDAARVRQPHRHLPGARRARPLPDPRRRRGQRDGGRALSVPDRAVQEAEVRVHRPRHLGQPHDLVEDDRGRGEGRDRDLDRRDREGRRRDAQGLARPGIRREPAHAAAARRCRPRLRARLAERRPALPDEGRQEVRLDAQPAGMGRRAAALAARASTPRAIPTSSATPSSCCTTKAGRCSTCRSIPG